MKTVTGVSRARLEVTGVVSPERVRRAAARLPGRDQAACPATDVEGKTLDGAASPVAAAADPAYTLTELKRQRLLLRQPTQPFHATVAPLSAASVLPGRGA